VRAGSSSRRRRCRLWRWPALPQLVSPPPLLLLLLLLLRPWRCFGMGNLTHVADVMKR
jgi:hypothetical protein